jgi:uncharacterized membrane protein
MTHSHRVLHKFIFLILCKIILELLNYKDLEIERLKALCTQPIFSTAYNFYLIVLKLLRKQLSHCSITYVFFMKLESASLQHTISFSVQ